MPISGSEYHFVGRNNFRKKARVLEPGPNQPIAGVALSEIHQPRK
jgi:hypothetical protein